MTQEILNIVTDGMSALFIAIAGVAYFISL